MTAPKPLFYATISYRTPAGRKVLYGSVTAAENPADCKQKLRRRLENEARFGRRRIGVVLEDFSSRFITMQIGKRLRLSS